MNLEHRAELYGVLALWIMLFHLNMFFNPLLGNVYLGRVASLGECCVDVFLFISGYCICRSWIRQPDYRSYFKKRVLRILPSYFLVALPFFIWEDGLSWNILYDISGASFLIDGKLDAWFPVAILLFYSITPFLTNLLKGKKGPWLALLMITVAVVLTMKTGFFSKTLLMWSRFPAYILGVLLAVNGKEQEADADKTACRARMLLCVLGAICLIAYALSPFLSFVGGRLGGGIARLCYLAVILPIIFLYNDVSTFIPQVVRRFFAFCGNISFELYLVHLFLIYMVSAYGLNPYLYPLALLVSIPLAYSFQRLALFLTGKKKV